MEWVRVVSGRKRNYWLIDKILFKKEVEVVGLFLNIIFVVSKIVIVYLKFVKMVGFMLSSIIKINGF